VKRSEDGGAEERGCACARFATALGGSFDPAEKPTEWRETSSEYVRSQFHSDFGSTTYRCNVCGSVIVVSFLERETDFTYRIESITPGAADVLECGGQP
jgi:hypothetical protein